MAFPIVVQHLVQLSQLRGIPQGLDHGANVAVLTFVTPLEMRVVLFEPQMEIIWESGSEWQLRYGLRYGLVWLGIGWKWTIVGIRSIMLHARHAIATSKDLSCQNSSKHQR